MVNRYYDGVVPGPGVLNEIDRVLVNSAEALPERVDKAMRQFAPHEALAAIWELIGAANKYVVEVKPWVLAKQRQQDPAAEVRLATTLYNLAETLRLVAHACAPFLPATVEAIVQQLGITLDTKGDWAEVSRWGRYPVGATVQPGKVLFPKLALSEKVLEPIPFK